MEELNTSIVGAVPRTDLCKIDFDSLLIPLYNKEGKREAICLAVPYLRQGDYPASKEGKDTYVEGVTRMYRQLYDYADSQRQPGEALLAMGHLHATGAELSEDDRSERTIMGGLESISVEAFNEDLAYTSELEAVPIPLRPALHRIPAEPASPAEGLLSLSNLPLAEEGADRSLWPYLEVQVLLTEPDPGFRHRVEEALADKAVRLTSIIPSYPKKEGEEDSRPFSYTDLQKIAPLDMLRHTFTNRFGGDLPEELEKMFNDVMREVSL